jgi:hypothetical protein
MYNSENAGYIKIFSLIVAKELQIFCETTRGEKLYVPTDRYYII